MSSHLQESEMMAVDLEHHHFRDHSLLSLDRLKRIPPGVRLIDDPDSWLQARGNAYGEENSRIWAAVSEGDEGITRQHVELIYDVVIRKGLRNGIRVLDLGCGTGPMALELAGNIGPEGEVHGIDVSEYQLEQARALAEKYGPRNVTFRRGSPSEGLPYEADSFDLVVSHIAFQLMPYKYKCLEETYRVLKPGGLLALVTDCETSWSHVLNAPESWCLVFDYVEKHAKETEGRVHYPLGAFPTLEQMDAWLTRIGFVEIDLAQHNPFHRIPPMFNRAYWSVWIDEELLVPMATYVQGLATEIMPRLGVTEPRLDVFARKQVPSAGMQPRDLGHAILEKSWIHQSRR